MAQLTKTQRMFEAGKRRAKEFLGAALLAGSLMLSPSCDKAEAKTESITVSKAVFDQTLCPKQEIRSVFDLKGANYVVLDKNAAKKSDRILLYGKGSLAFWGAGNGIGHFVFETEKGVFSEETTSLRLDIPVGGAVEISVNKSAPATFLLCSLSEDGREAAIASPNYLTSKQIGGDAEFRITDLPRREKPKKK